MRGARWKGAAEDAHARAGLSGAPNRGGGGMSEIRSKSAISHTRKDALRLIAFAVLALPATNLHSQPIRYEPGSARYEQNIILTSPQTLAAMGVPAEIKNRLILSTTISRLGATGDSLRLSVTVDSSTTTGAEAVTRGAELAPAGTKIERRMTPWGKSSPAATEIRTADQLIGSIIPVLTNSARLGSVWEDTLPVDLLPGNAIRGLTGQMVRSFLVSKDTTYAGESAWKIEIGSKTSVVASGMANSPVRIDGGGDGTGFIFLSKKGVLLYSNESQSLVMNIRLQNGGTAFPLETSTVRTVRRIK